jgi:hypothetical protein
MPEEWPQDYNCKSKKIDLNYKNCFVIANYSCHLFAYAIRLYPDKADINEVYVVCGDEYKVIANSFTEFIDLYLKNPDLLFY